MMTRRAPGVFVAALFILLPLLGACGRSEVQVEGSYLEEESEEVASSEAALCDSNPVTDPLTSAGRPKAKLSIAGGILYNALTNEGRRDLSEYEVNTFGMTYVSGCVQNFCALYFKRYPSGYYAYANVSRQYILVDRNSDGCYVPATDTCVRRLGGPVVSGTTVARVLNANANLRDIWHKTHGGDGEAPLSGYANNTGPCTANTCTTCAYVTGADAPPNTCEGGKGYVTGIYESGKPFNRLNRSTTVDVFRKSDGAPGKAEWVYGYVNTANGPVYMWVIRHANINGQIYWGYVQD
jgi:hypothetical protein